MVFFLVILSLSWWGQLVENHGANTDEFKSAINDVLWTLKHVTNGTQQLVPAKRSGNDVVESATKKPRSKQYIYTFFVPIYTNQYLYRARKS